MIQSVTEEENWEEWILFILKGIEETAKETLLIVKDINELLEKTSNEIKKTCQIFIQES